MICFFSDGHTSGSWINFCLTNLGFKWGCDCINVGISCVCVCIWICVLWVYLRLAVTVCLYVCLHMLVSCICLFVCLCFAGECCVFVLCSNGIQPLWICWQPGWLSAWNNSFMSINSKSSSGLWRYFFLTYMEVLMLWSCSGMIVVW